MERVYVGNLPPDIRIKDIDDFFRPFGKLIYIDVNHRANPVYAFVQFDSARNAFNAVKSRHGYDYEGYTLQLRLVENEVRKRRDATPPPPPPPPMLSDYGSQNNRDGYNNDFGNNNRGGYNNDFGNNNNRGGYNNYNVNRMGSSFANTSLQSSSSSQYASNIRSGMSQQQQQNMSQYPANNRLNTPQQIITNYQQQNMMPYSFSGRSNNQQKNSNSSNNNFNLSNMQQNSNSDRSNKQQNTNLNRSNMQQTYSNSNRSNMQQNMNSDRSNKQQNTNFNRSNMQHTYSNSNRLNVPQQYSNSNRSDMQQQNINNYSNMSQQQQNMMNYSNNSSWNNGNDNMGSNAGNNNYNNAAPNNMYNPNNDPYARPDFEDSFTNGLSGSGRKWFNRYRREGFSPEIARSKALEHRTLPYLRNNPKPIDPTPVDPTNMALETIGNTILSFLSTNTADNFNNENPMMQGFSNWGGDNFQAGFNNNVGAGNYELPGPSSSGIRENMVSQGSVGGQPRNRVSKQQYLKSVDILKKFSGKIISAKDRLSKKYHTKIVKDYEEFERSSAAKNRATRTLINTRNDKQIASKAVDGKTYTQLSIALRKKKQQLFIAARRMQMDPNKRVGGAYKKRMKILMNDAGFTELEAKALAIHPMEKLKDLLSLKADYDNASKRNPNSVALTKQIGNKSKMSADYSRDVNYLKKFEKHKLDTLSSRIKSILRAVLTRIHKHEKEAKLPLTKSKFTKLLERKPDQKPKTTATQKKQDANKKSTSTTPNKTVTATSPKKPVAEEKVNEPPTTNNDEQNTKNDACAAKEPQEKEINKKDITEEQHTEVNTEMLSKIENN